MAQQKIHIYQECWRCSGEGAFEKQIGEETIVEDPCIVCEGEGAVEAFYIKRSDLEDIFG